MTPASLRAAIDGAHDDDSLRRVLQSWAACLREPNDLDHMGLANELAPLAHHPSAKVRRALADVCDLLPGGIFDEVHALLTNDVDHYVCASTRRAGERRAEQRKKAKRVEQADQQLATLIAEIEEGEHGKAIRRSAEALARRQVEVFLARMSHEVTKADESIDRAFDSLDTELAKPDASLAKLRAHTALLRERAAFQRSLFRRARDYARPLRASFAPENVASMVVEARTQLADRLQDRAARLDFVLDVPASLEMHADRHAILQCLQNLLQNAVEAYAPDAERLTVRVTASALARDTQVELRVMDDGAGMTDEAKGDLFVPFSSRKPGGTGVGLLIARKMVEEVHGGTLDIVTALGKGTTAILTFPARQSAVRRRP